MRSKITKINVIFYIACLSVGIQANSKVADTSGLWEYKLVNKLNGYFKLHLIPATWESAMLQCSYEGGTLVSPTNDDLKRYMIDVMKTYPLTQGLHTGISSTFSKRSFYSIEGVPLSKVVLDWTNPWAEFEPDNKNDDEDCIAMIYHGLLADVSCKDRRSYLCFKKSMPGPCGTKDPRYSVAGNETSKCYGYHRNTETWSNAHMICSAEGGHLLILNSYEEKTAIEDLFPKWRADFTFAWIGFVDRNKKGMWRTIHGDALEEAGYERWTRGEPNQESSDVEYCGSITRYLEFNNSNCDERFPFICEKELYSGE